MFMTLMPIAGDRSSILPYIFIGLAVAIVVIAVVFTIKNKKNK